MFIAVAQVGWGFYSITLGWCKFQRWNPVRPHPRSTPSTGLLPVGGKIFKDSNNIYNNISKYILLIGKKCRRCFPATPLEKIGRGELKQK